MKTLICLILDRSGSMSGKEEDVIGGVNQFIEEQKKVPDPASCTFVRFDSGAIERFRPLQALPDVQPLKSGEYQPRGMTPLLDAVGRTISELEDDWKAEQPDRAILVIVTDGRENASREYTKDQVKEMIEARQKSGQWSFIYLGADVDAFAEAGGIGILASNTANFVNTSAGHRAAYGVVGQSVSQMRASNSAVAHNLGGDIDEDGTVTKTHKSQIKREKAQRTWTPPASTD